MKREIIPATRIVQAIRWLRGQKVLLDSDLAELYGVTTGNLNKAVKRNANRFPTDFMFQLTTEEVTNLKFQFGISSWGGRRARPYAFTEQGGAMLSSVLNSERFGERTRLACWRWRPRRRELFRLAHAFSYDSTRNKRTFRRGRRKEHARRVCSPE
jgi:hypothetical protein